MKKRPLIVLATASALAAVIYFSKPTIQRAVYKYSLYHDDAPSDVAFTDVLEHSSDPLPIVQDLWSRNRLAVRLGVMHYLRRHALEGSALWPSTRTMVLEATRCGDIEAAENALTVLENNHDPEGIAVATAMLHDQDPELRQYALLYLGRNADKSLIPTYIKTLDDPDPKVRSLAADNLAALTGQDFNLHVDADEKTTAASLASWKSWWANHHQEYASSSVAQTPSSVGQTFLSVASPRAGDVPIPPSGLANSPDHLIPATDFSLKDLTNKTIHLSDFHGHPVLINFWATWCPSCVREIPDLMDLQKRRPDLIVLGICLDKVPDADGDDAPDTTKGNFAANIKAYAADHHITYPVLLDENGKSMSPYGGGDLPVSILIAPQGNIRRRVLGPRTIQAWESMLDEVTPTPANLAAR